MADKRPFRIVLREGPPKGTLGGSLSGYIPPGAQYDYKPPSVFERYKALSIIFALLVVAILVFLLLVPRHPRPLGTPASAVVPAAPTTDPVYVLPVEPQKKP